MNSPAPRRRKAAAPPTGRTVKASITVDADLHARWAAAAALQGMDRSAFAVDAIRAACKGIVLIDRRKQVDRAGVSDRQGLATEISSDADEAA